MQAVYPSPTRTPSNLTPRNLPLSSITDQEHLDASEQNQLAELVHELRLALAERERSMPLGAFSQVSTLIAIAEDEAAKDKPSKKAVLEVLKSLRNITEGVIGSLPIDRDGACCLTPRKYGQLSLTERVSKRLATCFGDLWNEQTKEAFSRLTRTKNKLYARDHAAGKDRVATCVDVLDEEVRYKEPILFHIE